MARKYPEEPPPNALVRRPKETGLARTDEPPPGGLRAWFADRLARASATFRRRRKPGADIPDKIIDTVAGSDPSRRENFFRSLEEFRRFVAETLHAHVIGQGENQRTVNLSAVANELSKTIAKLLDQFFSFLPPGTIASALYAPSWKRKRASANFTDIQANRLIVQTFLRNAVLEVAKTILPENEHASFIDSFNFWVRMRTK